MNRFATASTTTEGQISPRPKGRGSQYVYEVLKQRILTLELAPGAPLEEAKLAAELGTSRTPVREALIRLGSERLVAILSNRGAQVASLDMNDLRSYFEALSFAQRLVTRLAAERRSDAQLTKIREHMVGFENAAARRDSDAMIATNRDFHVAIAEASQNTVLRDFCILLYDQGLRVSRMAVSQEFDREVSLSKHLDLIIADHRRFTELIETRAAEEAEVLADSHAELARTRILGAITQRLSFP